MQRSLASFIAVSALAAATFSATARAAADPVIAAAGDIACASATATPAECHQMSTSDILVQGGVEAVLPLGDLQYDSGSESDFRAYYNPAWGRVKPITRPAPGNHEYGTPGGAGYYAYFGSIAGDSTKGYYSYDIGAWHLIALNSNCSSVSCSAGSAQEQWLRADLAAHPTACTIAYWHHPRFSSGVEHGSDTKFVPFWNALHDYGADIVLNGHEHNYERFAPQDANGNADPRGIRQFVSGTGGRSHYPFGPPIANSEVRDPATFGVLKLTLHATSYDWKFVAESGGAFTDSGSAPCVDAAPRVSIVSPASGGLYAGGTSVAQASGAVADAPAVTAGNAQTIDVAWSCPLSSSTASLSVGVTDAGGASAFHHASSRASRGTASFAWNAAAGSYSAEARVTCTRSDRSDDGSDVDSRSIVVASTP